MPSGFAMKGSLKQWSLWSLLTKQPKAAPKPPRVREPKDRTTISIHQPSAIRADLPESLAGTMPMRERYPLIERTMLRRYGVRVRKWRSSTSGVAWAVEYRDGTTSRLIESPRPRGPMSAAVFLHEIGHHAIGLGRFKPRCLEEYFAWAFSLHQMHQLGIDVTPRVRKRASEALVYAVDKAVRRGLKRLPGELAAVLEASRRDDHEQVEALLVASGKGLAQPRCAEEHATP